MAAPNVWTQMNYVPPRGQCNHKQSVLSPKCPCLRFMLHPLKSASSYECDGCSHHASFHSLENKTEDEVRRRWEQEAKDKADQEDEARQRSKKRPRLLQSAQSSRSTLDAQGVATYVDGADTISQVAARLRSTAEKPFSPRVADYLKMADLMSGAAAPLRPTAKKPSRAAAAKARGRVSEIVNEEDKEQVIELD